MSLDVVTVMGTGCELANGQYNRDDDYNGHPCYSNPTTGLQLWNNHDEWRIGRTNDYFYVNASVEMTARSWTKATFQANPGGLNPAPVLRYGATALREQEPPSATEENMCSGQHVFGWPSHRAHVFIAGFNRYDGESAPTWSDDARLDMALADHFLQAGAL